VTVELFAGISVRDLPQALAWYEQLLGSAPAFFPNEDEAVWEVAEHRYVYVERRPQHAGHALTTLFVDDLDERVAAISRRGLNGVRKVTYRDADGNEFGFGGGPVEDS
jgi:hypothetical protein